MCKINIAISSGDRGWHGPVRVATAVCHGFIVTIKTGVWTNQRPALRPVDQSEARHCGVDIPGG